MNPIVYGLFYIFMMLFSECDIDDEIALSGEIDVNQSTVSKPEAIEGLIATVGCDDASSSLIGPFSLNVTNGLSGSRDECGRRHGSINQRVQSSF